MMSRTCDPGNAGNSYLLYKLLAHPVYRDGASSPGPEEHFRMRTAIVVGMPNARAPKRAIASAAIFVML